MVLVTPANGGDVTPDGTKTTKLSSINDSKGDAGQRLVEYFVVVSSDARRVHPHGSSDTTASATPAPTQEGLTDWKVDLSFDIDDEEYSGTYDFAPIVTGRYPVHDHRDNPLHENVTFFCHPSGGIRLRMDPQMPKVHYFVATGGHGKQMYGTCLTIWESTFIKLRKTSAQDTAGKKSEEESKTDPSLDDPNEKEKEVFVPKCLVLLSTYPYLMAFREFLTQLDKLSKMGEMILPIERYIANFCSEIPAPPSGAFEVQTTILDSVIKIWSPPDNQPIAWVSLPFGTLFECLDIDNIILVWHCLVLERQVLLTSTQLSVLTLAAEIFLSLLFPMRWSHAYIPLLPHFLIPILSAPMPFLCGINKANLADALYDLSSECVLVDLDKNLVTLGPDTQALPPIPPAQLAALKVQLEENVGMVFREARCLTKNDDYSDSGANLPNHIKLMAEGMWESRLCLFDEAFHLMFTPEEYRKNLLNGNDTSGLDWSEEGMKNDPIRLVNPADKQQIRKQSRWDAVQEAFLDTFVYVLRNFRKYLVFPSKHNEGSYGGAGFRSKEFIESQRFDMREFLQQMIGTQMFDNFITKRLYGSGEADVAFFDRAVDRFLKHAGIFSDVDLVGRALHAASVTTGVSGPSNTPDKRKNAARTKQRSAAATNFKKDVDPLLCSAKVHRKLKTIVPPEPSGEGLPSSGIPNIVTTIKGNDDETNESGDDKTIGSHSTATKTNVTNGTTQSTIVQSATTDKDQSNFEYPTFPSEFIADLFGTPRPLPSAVIAEFDRQRKDAAQFRRKKSLRRNKGKPIHRAHNATLNSAEGSKEAPPSPEVATFTVFFMAFTAMVGKELIEIAYDPTRPEKQILSTYVSTATLEETRSEYGSEMDDDSEYPGGPSSADHQEAKEGLAQMKTNRPMDGMFGDDDADGNNDAKSEEQQNQQPDKDNQKELEIEEAAVNKVDGASVEKIVDTSLSKGSEVTSTTATSSGPRNRFCQSLSTLQIEEAKATGRAQLGLAFEMLTMMKKRGLKADPEAYQCLIDACGRVGDTKRATDLLAKMHEDGIVADGTVYACLVSAFSAESGSSWKQGQAGSKKDEELPAWANSTSIEMDWNKLQKRSLLDRLLGTVENSDDEDDEEDGGGGGASTIQKVRSLIARRRKDNSKKSSRPKVEENRMEFFVTESVERQIALGENLLEIVFPDISVDTENETCPRCNFLLSDDDVVAGWTPGDNNDYTTACPNCTQRFVPHFCVQSTSPTFMGSRGPATALMCERLSPWVLQKEIRSVMSDREGIENLLSPEWREQEYKNAVLWWNLVLSCMRYRFPFIFLLQGSFDQNLIAPMPEDES